MIRTEKKCDLCLTRHNLEVHHCIHGSGRRKLADEDGLTVYLCHGCHMYLHDHRKVDIEYIRLAQRWYEEHIGDREQFRKRYGKSWLE